MAGPTSRAVCTIEELSAIALPRSFRSSTISITNAWRAGMSRALMKPWSRFNKKIVDGDDLFQREIREGKRLQHRERLSDD